MIRNAYSCPQGDRNLVGIITMSELQQIMPRGPAWGHYPYVFRRFVPPCSKGSGNGREMFVVIPEKWGLEAIPHVDFREGLRQLLTPADEFDWAAHPWVDGRDESLQADHAALDQALGGKEFEDRPGNRWDPVDEEEPAPQ